MEHFWFFVGIGFFAQLVDGALGMAYGVISMTMLLNFGVSPLIASASIHFSEIFTTGVSGISHAFFDNIDRRILIRLAIPGMMGGALGAYVLTKSPSHLVRIIILIYLILTGFFILYRAWRYRSQKKAHKHHRHAVAPLGFFGAFLDAITGGGWGTIVTSSLVALGVSPRHVVGSSNLAEFFVTLCQSFVFFVALKYITWNIVGGLLLGGIVAAPLAGYLVRIFPVRVMMFLIGTLVIVLSLVAVL
ncbi:MAG: hypothetical protein A3I77_03540 [Gammaproteobacteria bacterium RIFCSPLOWO2_02_FULL_42_14]|nr:MAG: hypothetical protein A3B71_04845 [Gammaproteobacteria bacterium RIFCSPHIGHO2_02_FULL_42_43]OGT29107.1 MAG: hypothetical protein A2624_06445 [Gammaproteobacteria bacterium RIFCSPHIGHO2_01_FULL_42_8]OGT51331.1 MAG: hypothetical protein A3E54_04610 [Gammaproteobacteria bacterium RIFCSPHIGHO2_12_FULL_41_25]OGT62033.1 MAG: hypothetical protein A3I77_03540 [Gammaproteobacteria bacterium RIFCSPLOWO2_02_FULL_42_14]OGT85706.1 MAG: hypothetical protein A3G86_03235 [Gammaproteobacteria bacterium R